MASIKALLVNDNKLKLPGIMFASAAAADCNFSSCADNSSSTAPRCCPSSDSSQINSCSTAACHRSSPSSPSISVCSMNSYGSASGMNKDSKESSLGFLSNGNKFVESSNSGEQYNDQDRLAAALRLLPGLPLLSNAPFFSASGLWMNPNASFSLADNQKQSNDANGNSSLIESFGSPEADIVHRFAQWQTQMMALNMMTSGLFGNDHQLAGIGEPHSSELGRTCSSLMPFFGGAQVGTTATISSASNQNGEDDEDKPLDLSASGQSNGPKIGRKSSSMLNKKEVPCKSHSVMKRPAKRVLAKSEQSSSSSSIPAKQQQILPDGQSTAVLANPKLQLLGTKRNYSQADLDAAVMDIRMGRLGTRRASVVYGIPRSTLRNKIYKLEAAEDNGDGSSKRRRLNAYALRKKDKSSQPAFKRSVSAKNSLIGSEGTQRKEKSLSQRQQKSACVTPPTESTQLNADRLSSISPGDALDDSVSMETLLLRPNSENKLVFGGTPPVLVTDTSLPSLNSFSEMLKQYVEKIDTESEEKSNHNSVSPPTDNNNSGDDEAMGESKRPRPKRGQYRKYDKGALEKAVASVRSGEMSVHRAGSFYGVPHSTLERNLLRHKNRRAAALGEGVNGNNNEETSHKTLSTQSSFETAEIVDSVVSQLVDKTSAQINDGEVRVSDEHKTPGSLMAELVEAVGNGVGVLDNCSHSPSLLH